MTSTDHQATSSAANDLGPLFQLIRDAVIVVNVPTGRIVTVNPAAEAMFGYIAGETTGLLIDALVPDRLLERYQQGQRTFETQALHSNGDQLWVEVTLDSLDQSNGDAALVVVRDQSLLRRHTTELSTLTELGRDLASTFELQPLLESLLDRLTTVVDSHRSTIILVDGHELRYAAVSAPELKEVAPRIRYNLERIKPVWDRLAQDEPIIMGDVRDDSPVSTLFRQQVGSNPGFETIRALMLTPLKVRGQTIGILTIARSEPHSITPHDVELTMAIARLAAVAIENARLYERERAAASLEERQRLARELHDSVAQALYSVKLYAEAAVRRLDASELDLARDHLIELRSAAREALVEMRLLLFHLRPSPLAEHGLADALRARLAAVEARSELDIQVDIPEIVRIAEDVEQELYRVAQEALNNVLRHSNARHVTLQLTETDELIRLEITDDGDGFDASARQGGGMGLPGMRERVDRLGGTLQVNSSPGNGVTIVAEVPR